ncbi:hypothetical protein SAMN04488063_2649 [Halopelagius inordinatus]|uniref:Uncharacterized protein n=1 Tax=Halopelagius inordinatus TaxID=553467 RepID=A0A1I2TDQ2_9EURY|nr:hypothetical protein [Halopelagius inordinatus]SFG63022.1 hypothetical protein SAMN04488063_2649 [Halopelagius inordinatus]
MTENLLSMVRNADSTTDQLDALAAAVERQTEQLRYLETALKAVGRATGVGICGRCSKCSDGVMLSHDGALKCSSCNTTCYLG